MSRVEGPGRPADDRSFDAAEVIEAEALLSGTGAGAEGGIVVPWPLLFRHRIHRRLARSERYQWWVLWTVLAGLLSVNITFTVFVVALPEVARQLHTSVTTLTWTSTGPLLAFGVAAPILGKLGDLRGYRRLYLWGLSGAALSVVLTASAPTAGVLIGARLFDGVQGAATGAASMALVLQAFSHEDRVKAMGWWALVGAGGPVLGVTIGAPIIQYFGWRALFWGELPLMAIAAVLAVIVLPAHDRPVQAASNAEATDPTAAEATDPTAAEATDPSAAEAPEADLVPAGAPAASPAAASPTDRAGDSPVSPWRQLDWIGSATLSGSVTAGLLGLNLAPSWGFAAPATLAIFAVSLVAGVGFVLHERRAPRPLIPLHYFRNRNFVFPLGARALVNFSYMGGFFLFPILMERVYGYSETGAGLLSTARPLMFSISAPIAGYAAVKVGERWSVVAGAVTLTVSMLVFTQLGSDPSVAVIIVALALSGLGNGISTPSTASSASNEVAPDELGVMSAAQLLITQIGIVAGIQVMVTVQASGHGGVGSLASFHRAYAVGAVVAVLAVVCGFFVRDMPRPGRVRTASEVPVA
ncbi:MAG TPA: MFS transporter [Acidimicrobiales bacterium]